jgi:Zn-dependent M28 family amino/carboxypeptidase
MLRRTPVLILIATAFVAIPRAQSEKLDYAAIGQIRDEGLNRSQVMDTLFWLTDRYGPRLTGSPQILAASDWAMKKMTDWGLSNVHREEWDFGTGWSLVRFSAHLVEPEVQPVIGFPKAWSVGTGGPITAEVTRVTIQNDADFTKYRGQLKGKIVLAQPARSVRMLEGPLILNMDEVMTKEAETTPIPGDRSGRGEEAPPTQAMRQFQQRLQQFYKDEGVVAVFDRGSDSDMAAGGSNLSWQQQRTDGGTVFPGTANRNTAPAGVPQVTLAVEHYNRMVRLIEHNLPVKAELDLRVQFHTNAKGFNTIAEIPGADLASEVVILGAHFDSVNAATGATDNAAGSAAMMEALRIIKALGLTPRRTIRVALWGGEEEGLLGSRAYVAAHFGDPRTMQLKAEHGKLAAYFNLDNGTGRIRGVWMQGNLAVRPIFEQWIAPLKDLGVTILGPRSVTQTDHVSFDNVGLPAFQFVQERLEYNSRTHHSNMDVYDRLQRDDMVQQATIAAIFAYDAAMREEKLPRKALPKSSGGPQGPPYQSGVGRVFRPGVSARESNR